MTTDLYLFYCQYARKPGPHLWKLVCMIALLVHWHPCDAQKPATVWFSDFRNEAFARLQVSRCDQYAVQKQGRLQLQESTVYDTNGYLLSRDLLEHDSLGALIQQKISYAYRPSEIKEFYINLSPGPADTLMIRTLYFDSQQRLLQQVEWKAYSGYTTSELYTYDSHDQCVGVSMSGNGGSSGEWSYELSYDPKGNLLRIREKEELAEENTYDGKKQADPAEYGELPGVPQL
jgi:hypothetical protein